jgi:type 1 glutamine amidotransferase
VKVASRKHPITRGLDSWTINDETYTMADAGEGNEILLTTDHPKSMKTLAWTRACKKARVFCFQCGHDNAAWSNATFREVMKRGIQWCARRI